MATPPEPSMHEYARFYNLSEDCTLLSPASYADESCDPYSLASNSECSAVVDPEERMKEVDRTFCNGILLERLPSTAEELAVLNDSLRPKPFKGNVWRGLLPIVKTTDLGPVPVLETFDGYDSPRLPSSLKPRLADSCMPTLSSGIELAGDNLVPCTAPGINFPGATNNLVPGLDSFGPELPDQSPVVTGINTLNHVTVPSGSDISIVPPVMREVSEPYNSSPDPDTEYYLSQRAKIAAEARRGLQEAEDLVAFAENMGYDENNLFPPWIMGGSAEEIHSTPKAQPISNAVSPVLTQFEAISTDVSQDFVRSGPSATQAGEHSMAPSTTSPRDLSHTSPSTPYAQIPIPAGVNPVCDTMTGSRAPERQCTPVNNSSPAAPETPSDGLGLGSLSMFMQTRGSNCEGDPFLQQGQDKS